MKLKTSQYEKIKMLIADLFEDYDIRKVPVDVFELSQKCTSEFNTLPKLQKRNHRFHIAYGNIRIHIYITIQKLKNISYSLMTSCVHGIGKDFH